MVNKNNSNCKENTKQKVKILFSNILSQILNPAAQRRTVSHLLCILPEVFCAYDKDVTKPACFSSLQTLQLHFFSSCVMSILTYQQTCITQF